MEFLLLGRSGVREVEPAVEIDGVAALFDYFSKSRDLLCSLFEFVFFVLADLDDEGDLIVR